MRHMFSYPNAMAYPIPTLDYSHTQSFILRFQPESVTSFVCGAGTILVGNRDPRLGLNDYHEWIERDAFSAEFEVGGTPSVCVDSAVGLLALSTLALSEVALLQRPDARSLHTHPAATRVAPGRSPCAQRLAVPCWCLSFQDGRSTHATRTTAEAGQLGSSPHEPAHAVSVRFLHARDPAGLAYPYHTLPLAVLEALP